jgi:Sulfotransferase family
MALRGHVQEQSAALSSISFCPEPVFIIGSPRSGTSALAWALYHHPAFWTSKETDFLQRLFGSGQATDAFATGSDEESWFGHNEVGKAEFLEYLGLGVNALITSRSEGKRWVDQTPSYTVFVRDLAALFPGARFLHIVRDGRAVVNSMVHFAEGIGRGLQEADQLPHWAAGFREACETWVSFCRAALDFAAAQPERVLYVRNEDLVSEPEEGFARILEFLGEQDNPGPANFFASSRINSSFVPMQWGEPSARRRMPSSSPPADAGLRAWQTWSEEQQRLFSTLSAELMVELGYASDFTEAQE